MTDRKTIPLSRWARKRAAELGQEIGDARLLGRISKWLDGQPEAVQHSLRAHLLNTLAFPILTVAPPSGGLCLDGWQAWAGGGFDVHPCVSGTVVEIQLRDGSLRRGQIADFTWEHDEDTETDIVAWRIAR